MKAKKKKKNYILLCFLYSDKDPFTPSISLMAFSLVLLRIGVKQPDVSFDQTEKAKQTSPENYMV